MKDFTPVDPNISMYIPLFVPYTFPMALTRRIMLKNQKLFKFAIISIILMSLMYDSVVTSWWEISAKCPPGVIVLGVEICDFWVNFLRTWVDSFSSKSSVPLVTCICVSKSAVRSFYCNVQNNFQLGLFLLTSFFVYLVQALCTTVENFKCPSSEVWQGECQLWAQIPHLLPSRIFFTNLETWQAETGYQILKA